MTAPSDQQLIEAFPSNYKHYWDAKRYNFFAAIRSFPCIWNLFMLIDSIIQRDLGQCATIKDKNSVEPLCLFMVAHSKVRVALELGMSGNESEAISIMRDAIESAATARRIHHEPTLREVWKSGTYGERRDAFMRDKAEQLFKDVPDLLKVWKNFSNLGSHPTPESIVNQLGTEVKDGKVFLNFTYIGTQRPEAFVLILFELLAAAILIERTLFLEFEGRLHLDHILVDMRAKFQKDLKICNSSLKPAILEGLKKLDSGRRGLWVKSFSATKPTRSK